MKEFIDKLIERLEEYEQERLKMYDWQGQSATFDAIAIIKDIAEEYRTCYKSCMECEAYNKEKHYCPKWCEVIKHTTSELAEEYKSKKVNSDLISRSEVIKELNEIYLDNPWDSKEDILEKAIGRVEYIAPYTEGE